MMRLLLAEVRRGWAIERVLGKFCLYLFKSLVAVQGHEASLIISIRRQLFVNVPWQSVRRQAADLLQVLFSNLFHQVKALPSRYDHVHNDRLPLGTWVFERYETAFDRQLFRETMPSFFGFGNKRVVYDFAFDG